LNLLEEAAQRELRVAWSLKRDEANAKTNIAPGMLDRIGCHEGSGQRHLQLPRERIATLLASFTILRQPGRANAAGVTLWIRARVRARSRSKNPSENFAEFNRHECAGR